ncbi:hypothetical protein HDV06_005563 [Boothiomyces sp. JEL0866]|nr:hypothetical protein HDV06_005563 [Boothiomyces sp. JEL0866]
MFTLKPLNLEEGESQHLIANDDLETEINVEENYGSVPVVEDNEDKQVSCFRSLNAYLLGLHMSFVVGVGLMYTNNLGAIIIALLPEGVTSKDPTTQILQKSHASLLSIASFGSRILTGFLADICAQYFNIQRTVWAILSALCMTFGCIAILYQTNIDGLYLATTLIAIADGSSWTVLPVLVGEYFGKEKFSRNW